MSRKRAARCGDSRLQSGWKARSSVGALKLAEQCGTTRGYTSGFLVEAGYANNMADVFKKHLARENRLPFRPQWCSHKNKRLMSFIIPAVKRSSLPIPTLRPSLPSG